MECNPDPCIICIHSGVSDGDGDEDGPKDESAALFNEAFAASTQGVVWCDAMSCHVTLSRCSYSSNAVQGCICPRDTQSTLLPTSFCETTALRGNLARPATA